MRHLNLKNLLILFFITLSKEVYSEQSNNGKETVQQAIEKKTASQNAWHKLLHYQAYHGNKQKSHARGDFFFSPEGMRDPEKELISFLYAIYEPLPSDNNEHAICRFPARYYWLSNQLPEIKNIHTNIQCTKFETFYNAVRPESVSLVFVTATMTEPASMFGHLFVKLNKKGEEVKDDKTFSYVGNVNTGNIVLYIYRGLTGGFPGIIEYLSFGGRMRQYNILENRNMWELELSFNHEESRFLVMHLWEVESASFDYYFFDENCAYHNLYLLEVVKPEIDISRKFNLVVLPVEVIKGILKTNNLLTSAHFYPANYNNFINGYRQLDRKEKKYFNQTLKSNNLELATVSVIKKDKILNTLKYYLTQSNFWKDNALNERNSKLLKQVEEFQGKENISNINFAEPDYTNPSIGHNPSLLMLGVSKREKDYFTTLRFRPYFHDSMDSPLGYVPFSEISVLDTRVEFNVARKKISLTKVHFLKLLSLRPVSDKFFFLSWQMQFSLLNVDHSGKYALMLKNGYGTSFHLPLMPDTFLFYFLGNGMLPYYIYPETLFSFGGSFQSGIIWSITNLINYEFSSEYSIYYHNILPELALTSSILWYVAPYLSLEAGVSYEKNINSFEYQGALKLYF